MKGLDLVLDLRQISLSHVDAGIVVSVFMLVVDLTDVLAPDQLALPPALTAVGSGVVFGTLKSLAV